MDRIHNITRRHKKCCKLIRLLIYEGSKPLIMYTSNCIYYIVHVHSTGFLIKVVKTESFKQTKLAWMSIPIIYEQMTINKILSVYYIVFSYKYTYTFSRYLVILNE